VTGGADPPQIAYSQWLHACKQAGWPGTPAAELVAVRDGLGRVLAAEVRARWSVPRFACAAMDGIAISIAAVPPDAGEAGPWRLAAGTFVPVDTGDPMPPGTDTVLIREHVTPGRDGSAKIRGATRRGRHVRPTGEDIEAGELLLPAGHRLGPADLAAIAATGHSTVQAARRPVVAIIPTGDEIQPAGSALGPADVVDSNSLMLAARAGQVGAVPLVRDIQPDDRETIAAELRRAAVAADLVVIIAGSSAGRDDYTTAVIAEAGELAVSGVAVRPGRPALLGYARPGAGPGADPVPVIGIPGYPLAAAVTFELFAVPLLAALQGCPTPDRSWQEVRLGCDWDSPPGVEEWVPVTLGAPDVLGAPGIVGARDVLGARGVSCGDGALVAMPQRRGAGTISQLMRASAWWPIPIGQGHFAGGESVHVHPLPGAGGWG
jgi:putative molybdopterin biosynthesis protein